MAGPSCWASCKRATPTARSAWRGTPKKSSGRSTPSTIPPSPNSSWDASASISKTLTVRPRPARLGRTIARWANQIVAWHRSRVSNGPTEAVNNLIKRVKRIAFGFRNFANYRIRSLLYAGRPNWALLATITPR